jgi:hypothetical protein
MTLTELVPSLEVCQQLKRVGFPQDTALVWFFRFDELNHYSWVTPRIEEYNPIDDNHVAAPTAEEILKELPETIDKMTLDVFGNADTWMVGWYEYQHLRGKLRDWMREKHGEQPGIVMQPLAIVAALAYLWWKEQE